MREAGGDGIRLRATLCRMTAKRVKSPSQMPGSNAMVENTGSKSLFRKSWAATRPIF